ncbi:MAG: hypothetical protein C0505_15575 [Leptothrix sp. (in: Bacteria)]|nr:hypothetical protein [Leptothrix sp. (in: b-proteobacteria)]
MPAPGAPPVIDSRSGWHAALSWGFGTAMAQEARRIVVVAPDFADWPLDDPALLQALTGWLRLPQRRLVLLAAGFEALPRRCPRFTSWRAPWMHAIEGWQVPDDLARDLPTVLTCDKGVSVQLIDAQHWRGRADVDDRRARQWGEEIDVVLQRSERALAVRSLGL